MTKEQKQQLTEERYPIDKKMSTDEVYVQIQRQDAFAAGLDATLLTPSADVQERAKELELFKRLWYNRNPVHENNADSGEDMFWGTAELVAREYAQHLAGASSLQAENERLREALEKILAMKEPGNNYAFNRCWHIAHEALNKQ